MDALLSIAKLFNANPSNLQFREDFDNAVLKATIPNLSIPAEGDIRDSLSKFFNRDVVHCDVTIDESDPISLHSTQPNLAAQFVTTLADILEAADSSPIIQVAVTVEKRVIDARLSIYSLEAFAKHLSTASPKNLLIRFSELLNQNKRLHCMCLETIEEFNTETFWFENANLNRASNPPSKNRETIFSKRNEVCHFENSSEVQAIPEDFFLQNRSKNSELNESFDRLCVTTSLIFICDIVQFESESLIFYKLNGYKAITGKLNSQSISGALAETYFKIYQWIYEGGVINDKIGLARNLLSLHARKGNILELEADVFTSIRSGYQIYLKQNVKQYIDLKNKLLEFLTELSKKGAKLGEELGDKLGKHFVAFASFFLSVVVVKAISNQDFTGNFTPKLAAIAYFLLTASIIHWFISLLLLNREIRQMEKSYLAVQKRYDDLLDPKDLANIFNDDDEYQSVLGNVRYKRMLYSLAWIGYIVLFGVLVAFLTVTNKTAQSPTKSINPTIDTNYFTVSNSMMVTNPTALTNFISITNTIFITNSIVITNPAAASKVISTSPTNPASPMK